jgi:hypothetical protein
MGCIRCKWPSGRRIAFRVFEALTRGYLHQVTGRGIERPIAAVLDGRAGRNKERLGLFDTLHRLRRDGLTGVVRWQSVNLFNIEDGIALHECDSAFGFLPVVIGFCLSDAVGIDDQ